MILKSEKVLSSWKIDQDHENVLVVPLDCSSSRKSFIGYGQIYSKDEPVAFVQTLSEIERNGNECFFKLFVHDSWILASHEDLSLQNLKVLSEVGHTVLDSRDSVAIVDSRVRRNLKRSISEITDEMRMGKRPAQTNSERTGIHKVVLVHGYCAGTNPFPASHFTNYQYFYDLNTNRATSTFASLIMSSTSNLNGCGMISHSQGGLAALYIYTYYWSCLDYAEGGTRMMQSVGTPYQGTNLGGILATIGSWFGVQCGSNYDLTYSGAAANLPYFPSWARGQVYYHTTSFTDNWYSYDYCNLLTDVVLTDPDDGVTERDWGQLPYAYNMGHVEGQCHTTGMRDPPQCENYARNSVMNANARR